MLQQVMSPSCTYVQLSVAVELTVAHCRCDRVDFTSAGPLSETEVTAIENALYDSFVGGVNASITRTDYTASLDSMNTAFVAARRDKTSHALAICTATASSNLVLIK